jgi:hypothetical protein
MAVALEGLEDEVEGEPDVIEGGDSDTVTEGEGVVRATIWPLRFPPRRMSTSDKLEHFDRSLPETRIRT